MNTSRALALIPLLALCTHCTTAAGDAQPVSPGVLGQAFTDSAHAANVAEPLLYALADIEEGFDDPLTRKASPNVEAPQAGPFHLRHAKLDTLGQAARLQGVTELALREDSRLALTAGSKLLASVLAQHGAAVPENADERSVDWASVKAALGAWSGYADSWHQADYATRVLGALARGGEHVLKSGEVLQYAPMSVPPALLVTPPKPAGFTDFVVDYSGAEAFPMDPSIDGKYMVGRDGYTIDTIVIHDTEGGWEGSVATFQSEGSTSVHYLVGKDGRIAQFTHEKDCAYHAGNRIYNRRAIGIEHVGFADQEFPDVQYAKSAELVRHLVAKYSVVPDRQHIIGHDQVPSSVQPDFVAADGPPCMESPSKCQDIWYYGGSSGHTDPGIWQWGPYMARVGAVAKCNDLPTALTCDSTGTYAMGCIDGDVEVHRCATTCTTGGDAGAVSCEIVTEPPVVTTQPIDAGPDPVLGHDAGAPATSTPPSQTGTIEESSSPTDDPAPAPGSAPLEEGGCSTHGRTGDAGSALAALVALAAVVLQRRRR